MRVFLIALLCALSLSATAQAGNPSNLCSHGGWTTAQSSSGQTFRSQWECMRAREVYKPTLSTNMSRVGAGQQLWLTASGFHANANTTFYFTVPGQAAYYEYHPYYATSANGSFSIPFTFMACGVSSTDLIISMIDTYGVYASVRVTLC